MTFQEAQAKGLSYAEIIIKNNDKFLIQNYRDAYNAVNEQLRTLYLKIQAEGIPKAEYYNYMTKFKRLERLQEQIYIEYGKAYRTNRNILVSNSSQVMTDAYYRRQYLINWTIDADQIFVVLDDKVIRASVLGTAEKWGDLAEVYGAQKNYIPQANTLLSTLKANNLKALDTIQRTLTQGFLQGTSYTKLAKEMKDVFGGITYNSLRVARTEGVRTMNAGNLAATNIARSEGIEIERQWEATLDSRTRQTHSSADGRKEDNKGQFHVGSAVGPYPGNMSTAGESVNCRCTTIDIIDGVDPEIRRARDPATGETDIISYKNFNTWAKDNSLTWSKKGWVKK